MKNAYPVILSLCENSYVVYIPDFNINTQGDSVTEAVKNQRGKAKNVAVTAVARSGRYQKSRWK